jgi:hypothetical protein
MNRLPTELIQLIFKAGPLHCLKNLSACNRRLRRVFCPLVRKIIVYAHVNEVRFLLKLYPNLTAIHGPQGGYPWIVGCLSERISVTCGSFLFCDETRRYSMSLSVDQLPQLSIRTMMAAIGNVKYLRLKLCVPDCQSSDLSLPQPVCLVRLLESLVDLPCRIKIIASTRYNAVTFTNRAYRAHLQGGPALLPEEPVSMQ